MVNPYEQNMVYHWDSVSRPEISWIRIVQGDRAGVGTDSAIFLLIPLVYDAKFLSYTTNVKLYEQLTKV